VVTMRGGRGICASQLVSMTVVEDSTSSPDTLQFDAAHKGKVRRYILRAASDVSITQCDPVLEMAQWRDTLLRHHHVALDRQQHPGGIQTAIQRMRCATVPWD
jgi:hypothetical protein